MADQALKKVEDQLQCAICLGTYKEPKLLQCFHVFCKGCLVELVVQDQQGSHFLNCPSCRQSVAVPTNGVDGLQAAFHIHHLQEIRDDLKGAETPLSSTQISVIGELSDVPDLNVDSLRDLEISSLNLPQPTSYCFTHNQKKLELFCETCNKLICLRCVVLGGYHHRHSFCEVIEVFQRYREEIEASVQPMDDMLAQVRSAIKQLDECDQETYDHDSMLLKSIHESIKELHEIIEARRMELVIELGKLTETTLEFNAAQRDKLGVVEAQLQSCLGFMSECLKLGRHGEVLSMKKSIMTRVEQLERKFNRIIRDSSTETNDVAFLTTSDIFSMCRKFGLLSIQYDASGKGLEEAVAGEISTAIVRTSHFDDQHEGDGRWRKIECVLISDITAKQVVGSVELLDNNQHKISYEPTEKGRHQLHVKVSGKHITGSPFLVSVRPSLENTIGSSLRTISGISKPCGIAFNTKGDIVVTEDENHCVSIFGVDGSHVHTFGMQGSGKGQLFYPRGIAVMENGNIVIADSSNHRITIFSEDGQFVDIVGEEGRGPLQFSKPKDVACNPKTGQIYIVDSNHRVQILNSDLTYSGMFGKAGKKRGNFNDPYGIACDNTGRVYVADTMNDRVQIFTSNGNFLREILLGDGVDTQYPVAVAVDPNHFVYVSEYCAHRVTKFNSKGSFVASFENIGTAPNHLKYPRGIAVDGSGIMCVCDFDNDRVSIF